MATKIMNNGKSLDVVLTSAGTKRRSGASGSCVSVATSRGVKVRPLSNERKASCVSLRRTGTIRCPNGKVIGAGTRIPSPLILPTSHQ